MYCDFACDVKLDTLPSTHRLRDPNQGGGALLDLGIYPLTLSNLILDGNVGDNALQPNVISSMTVVDGVDCSDVITVNYTSKRSVGILTASFQRQAGEDFCWIEGSEGNITLSGLQAANPKAIKAKRTSNGEVDVHAFEYPGMGLYFEANAVALDILAGRVESSIMPWAETRRMFQVLDGIRSAGQVVYPQDLE